MYCCSPAWIGLTAVFLHHTAECLLHNFAGGPLSPLVSQKPITTALLRNCQLLEAGLCPPVSHWTILLCKLLSHGAFSYMHYEVYREEESTIIIIVGRYKSPGVEVQPLRSRLSSPKLTSSYMYYVQVYRESIVG